MEEREQGLSHISDRLAAVAARIPPGRVVADIGSDHGLLLIFLARQGGLKRGIAGEVNQGPFENACKRIWDQGLTNRVEVRLGDGLSVLRRDEADVVVLAGMGGVLISSILSRGKDRIQGVERLVLQPNNNGDRVRAWLLENGWEIDGEDLVKERGVLYEIISARQGDPHFPYRGLPLTREQALELGPLLWRDRHPLLGEKVKEELLGLNRILASLQSARSPEAVKRREELDAQRRRWEEVHSWLSKEKI
ncbi:SAM-dependent methyltransferase [Kroppenstedtia guangzhouensis]|uniref:SAM-dependent methyltransferase n=1 Tax=Kroppenstedtia guangzhouensis TaxID=1274356 RepID=A0ABQ1G372_9BACL|nr:class I SAM-dependent methyltransferase [Kroppenstedtia guangzhouensis]GGA36175.1 SAM-dependent methyltransferase [Kroppenstedtia guangzhouensis]